LRGRPVHRREWILQDRALIVTDRIEGSGQHLVEVIYHAHPDVAFTSCGPRAFSIKDANWPTPASVTMEGPVACQVGSSSYHPEFGVSVGSTHLCGRYEGPVPVEIRTVFDW
jgi:hypothetical protein